MVKPSIHQHNRHDLAMASQVASELSSSVSEEEGVRMDQEETGPEPMASPSLNGSAQDRDKVLERPRPKYNRFDYC